MSIYIRMIQTSLAILFLALTVHAQVQVDQSLQIPPPPPPFPPQTYHYDGSLRLLRPETGQEFTPSFNALNFVDLTISASSSNATGTFEVAIHHGDITSPVLGLSNPTTRADVGFSSDNNTRFLFQNLVSLTPGDTYVLELIQLSGDSIWAVESPGSLIVGGQPIDMTYAGGRLIYNGVPQSDKDLLFQEGIITAVPEPGTTTYALLAIATFVSFTLITRRHTRSV